MAGIQYVIDPDGVPLAFSKANGYDVLAPVKSKRAPEEKLLASNIDSEGELSAGSKLGNSEHTLPLRLIGEGESQFRQRQEQLDQKLHKLGKEGGVLRVIYPDETFIDWEVRAVDGGERLTDNRWIHHQRAQAELTFVCAPFGEGEEELLEEFSGEAQRALECIVEVGGSAPALARAVVTSPDADILDLKWGRDSRRYSPAETAKAFYPAVDLTPLDAAATTATVDGKAETPVVRATLSPNWTASLSTQIAGVGQMTHEGAFEVLVTIHMPTGNEGEVGVGFEYSVGGAAKRISLDPIYFDVDHSREGEIILLSLGQVFLSALARGAHQWEGRVLLKSTVAGDILDIVGDVILRPLSEGRGEVGIEPSFSQPSALLMRDEFDQASGGLDGKTIAAAGFVVGPVSPGTVKNSGEGPADSEAWINPDSVKASDDNRATVALGPTAEAGLVSDYMDVLNFGLSLPEGATPLYAVGELERSKLGSGEVLDNGFARLVVGGTLSAISSEGDPATQWPPNDAMRAYKFDLSGLTAADLNAEGFGFAVSAVAPPQSEEVLAQVDSGQMTVVYTTAEGQKWSTTGDAADLSVETAGHTAQRTEVSDADIDTGRYAIAGATELTDTVVGIACKRNAVTVAEGNEIRQGVLARYSSTNNWLMACFHDDVSATPGTYEVRVLKRVGGTVTTLATRLGSKSFDWRHLWLQVDRRGRWFLWGALTEGGIPQLLLVGQDGDLAEGGALAEGKAGFYDAKIGANACTRNYDDFVVWIPPIDAVIFEGLSLELAHDRVEREALGGGLWSSVTPSGDYLKLEPEGMEERKNRLVFVASPNDPETMGVGFPIDLEVAIYAKRRHRTIPNPVEEA